MGKGYGLLTTWLPIAPAVLVGALVVFVPGLVIAWVAGARRMSLWAAAPPVSLTIVGFAAIAARMVNIRWSLLPVVLLTVLAAAVALGFRFLITRCWSLGPGLREAEIPRSPAEKRHLVGSAVAVILATALACRNIALMMISPSNFSQTYDGVFHLNATRFILETGNGSSLAIANLDPAAPAGFYPAVWHDLAALICQTASVTIPAGQAALVLVVGGLVWTLGCFYLASRIIRHRTIAYVSTAVVSAAFGQFPFHLVDFGVLYPTLLAVACLPAMVGLASEVLALSPWPGQATLTAAILLLVAVPGVALAHPSALMALGVSVIVMIVCRFLGLFRSWYFKAALPGSDSPATGRGVLYFSVGAIVFIVAFQIAWNALRPSDLASFWPPAMLPAQAAGEALLLSATTPYVPWVLAGLLMLGAASLVRQRGHVWPLFTFAAFAFLYMVVAGFPKGETRSYFTQTWYNDAHRLAALLPVFAAPLAAMGVAALFAAIRSAVRRAGAADWRLDDGVPRLGVRTGAVGLVAAVLAAVVLQVPNANQTLNATILQGRTSYEQTDDSELVDADELAVLRRLPQHVAPNAVIMVNPGTGASLAFALEGRSVTLPAVGSSPNKDEALLATSLPSLGKDPAVCDAIHRTGVKFVLDFGAQEINNEHHQFPTSAQLAAIPGLKVVDQQGEAKLYAVTGCGG